ncbi:MAG: DUF1926 domain-containing protein [Deltaproteobacteria bacterium]|nr:DUF1926 domain-containing protein [Deltaproteobacteria bacterium]
MHAPLELVLLLHLNLPSGSSRTQCELAWENCFQPIIGALHHTPDARTGLLLAGELVQELQDYHPEAIEWIRGLVERGQVEVLATALYEPILAAIPERDAVGQINVHAGLIRTVFGVRPTGCWLPYGMWEPTFPRILAAAGMKWAVIPDRHLETVGEPEGQVNGIYRTEREGHAVALLPLDTRVQEVAAEVPVKQVLEHLRDRARRGDRLVGLGLHGSRFGLHPGSCPKKDQSWFATLLAAIGKAHRSVEPLLPSHAVALGVDRGRIYLPTLASAGIPVPWERFLVRYEGANRLHKKMLRVSRLIEKLDRYLRDDGAPLRPDPTLVEQARRYLYRAQSSPAYWHQTHGGLYDPVVRELAWKDVLRGEHTALLAMSAAERLIVELVDMDCDGANEILLFTADTAMVVNPSRGGAISELSISSPARNLADTLCRVAEPYHAELSPEDPLREHLVVDGVARDLFTERFLAADDTLDNARHGTCKELGSGFQDRLWEVVTAERHGSDAVRAVLNRDGVITDERGRHRVRIQKRYTLRQRTLNFRHELTNRGPDPLQVRHALELNLFLGPDTDAQVVSVEHAAIPVGQASDWGMVEIVRVEGRDCSVELHLLQPVRLWHYPIRSVYRHMGEWRSAIQGVCLMLVQGSSMDAGKSARLDLKLRVQS